MIKQLPLQAASGWSDYELIDVGGFEKLERFGQYITIRPEPQAIWDKVLTEKEWNDLAHVKFIGTSSSSGKWEKYKEMPDNWEIKCLIGNTPLHFNLALTRFKHIGIFPEQSVNWNFIYQKVASLKDRHDKVPVLNLFAYTGGASLAACAAGAEVYHVDSIKQVVSWSKRNMESSSLKDIRWVVEDAVKFVKREIKRGKKYKGIILDPPAFGHGPNGESWKLELMINDLVKDVIQLLDTKDHFLVMNTYSLGFSALILQNIVQQHLHSYGIKDLTEEYGELYIPSQSGVQLPLGVYARLG
ncbi:MAG: class I SAM-dependent methyltransferase [Chitinophagales bacterium]|nr:class I SAM-dependent methyltransferase [Chitinophagales bacterium]MCZ2394394.1 class I SAM-dependent methyltransferase [Chitinophagales bacterium]